MVRSKNVVQRIKEEETDSYSDDSLFRISSYGADLSFRELISSRLLILWVITTTSFIFCSFYRVCSRFRLLE